MKKLINFIKKSRVELKEVKWPTKEQAIKYTRTVIIMSLLVAAFLGTLDLIFNWAVTKIL